MSSQIISEIRQAITDKGHNYFFDKLNKRLILLAKNAQMLEYGSFQACQSVHIERKPENFVSIEPISEADEFEWMNEFAAIQSNFLLIEGLSGENPFEAFFDIISATILIDTWQEFYNQKINLMCESIYDNLFH